MKIYSSYVLKLFFNYLLGYFRLFSVFISKSSDKLVQTSKSWWCSKYSWVNFSLNFNRSENWSWLEIFSFSYQSSCWVQGRRTDSVFPGFISRTYSINFESQIWSNGHRRHKITWSKGHKPLRLFCYHVGAQTSTQKNYYERENTSGKKTRDREISES